MLVVSDLDGTAIFSKRALAGAATEGLVAVDVEAGETHAYMTQRAIRAWRALAEAGVIVPVTTRTAKQYLRVKLPGPAPRYAVVANGGHLLVDGEPDKAWAKAVRKRLKKSGAPFDEVWARVSAWAETGRFRKVRSAAELFAYVVAAERDTWLEEFAAEQANWAAELGWRASLQGRKLYVVPTALDKAIAVRDLADRLGAVTVVAGGDSLLDRNMLDAADAAVRPAHGELHAIDWQAPHLLVTSSIGAAAGEEILRWYVEQALPAA
jgi:hydroxymethylpyrimidine pyrophosphatase-like HAD family hydrolase